MGDPTPFRVDIVQVDPLMSILAVVCQSSIGMIREYHRMVPFASKIE